MMNEFRDEMKAAADRMDFEKAAEIRNLLDDLRRTTAADQAIRPAVRHHRTPDGGHARAAGGAGDGVSRRSIIECFDISNISITHKVASMVCFAGGKPDRSNYRRYRIRTVAGQDDFASMAEVVRRRYSRVLNDGIRQAQPDRGGRRQGPAKQRASRAGERWDWPTCRSSDWPRSGRKSFARAIRTRW